MTRLVLNSLAFVSALFVLLAPALPARAQTLDAAELLLRLDRLENENRRLNGQVEQLTFQNRRLEEQLRKFQADVDFRFREAGGKGLPTSAPAAALPAPAAQSPTAPATPQALTPGAVRRGDAFDPAANPAAPGAPRTIGQAAAQAALPPPANAAPGTARGDFDFAKAFFDRGEFELAEGSFRDFLRVHARDRLAADAVFFIGEAFFRRNRFREAAEQYLTVTTTHARAARAPEAMLKLGMSLRGLGAKDEACGAYAEVGRKYPNASASVKQAVERERRRAQCAA